MNNQFQSTKVTSRVAQISGNIPRCVFYLIIDTCAQCCSGMPLTVGNCFTAFLGLMAGMAVALLLFCAEFAMARAGIRMTLLGCYGDKSDMPLERAIEKLIDQTTKQSFKHSQFGGYARRRKSHKKWKSAEDLRIDERLYSHFY